MIACNKGTYDYSFTPEAPRAGETVTFTNLSTAGDDWTWQFGDGAVSTLKNPTHVFKRVGTFNVTLMVDSSQHKTVVKQITVYDTVPSFKVSTDSLLYMQKVSFTALVYNPYSKSVEYKWTLPECAEITSGGLESSSVTVYFTRPDTTVNVSLRVTLDGKETTIDRQLTVHDYPTTGLWLASADIGQLKLLRQRLFDEAVVQAQTRLSLSADNADSKISQIISYDNSLLLLQQHRVVALTQVSSEDFSLTNLLSADLPICRCDIYSEKLYLATGIGKVYVLPLPIESTISQTQLSEQALLLDLPYSVDNLRLASEQVVYLQTKDSIVKAVVEAGNTQPVLSATIFRSDSKAITDFALDPIAQKLYIIDGGQIVVCSADGTNPVRSELTATCLYPVNSIGLLYYANEQGVWQLPLVLNAQNRFSLSPLKVSDATHITAIAYDEKEK